LRGRFNEIGELPRLVAADRGLLWLVELLATIIDDVVVDGLTR